jgi:hypothetical protein
LSPTRRHHRRRGSFLAPRRTSSRNTPTISTGSRRSFRRQKLPLGACRRARSLGSRTCGGIRTTTAQSEGVSRFEAYGGVASRRRTRCARRSASWQAKPRTRAWTKSNLYVAVTRRFRSWFFPRRTATRQRRLSTSRSLRHLGWRSHDFHTFWCPPVVRDHFERSPPEPNDAPTTGPGSGRPEAEENTVLTTPAKKAPPPKRGRSRRSESREIIENGVLYEPEETPVIF